MILFCYLVVKCCIKNNSAESLLCSSMVSHRYSMSIYVSNYNVQFAGSGQLGNGNNVNQMSPVKIDGLKNVTIQKVILSVHV